MFRSNLYDTFIREVKLFQYGNKYFLPGAAPGLFGGARLLVGLFLMGFTGLLGVAFDAVALRLGRRLGAAENI